MQQQRTADTGSRTLTISRSATPDLARAGTAPTTASESEAVESPPVGVLRLRGGPTGRRRVVWRDDTVDNEGMGKKKSKICCIYHRPRAFDESSTESSSGSDDDDDDDDVGDSHQPNAGPSGSGRNPKAPRGIMKRREGGGGEVEQSSESDSEGGQGDGRARPARKPRRKHRHSRECDHGPGDHAHGHSHGHKHASKPNRYDHQEKHGTPGQAVNP